MSASAPLAAEMTERHEGISCFSACVPDTIYRTGKEDTSPFSTERPTGNVIGMHMRVHGVLQTQAQLLEASNRVLEVFGQPPIREE
jgi:hypothetical protein